MLMKHNMKQNLYVNYLFFFVRQSNADPVGVTWTRRQENLTLDELTPSIYDFIYYCITVDYSLYTEPASGERSPHKTPC